MPNPSEPIPPPLSETTALVQAYLREYRLASALARDVSELVERARKRIALFDNFPEICPGPLALREEDWPSNELLKGTLAAYREAHERMSVAWTAIPESEQVGLMRPKSCNLH